MEGLLSCSQFWTINIDAVKVPVMTSCNTHHFSVVNAQSTIVESYGKFNFIRNIHPLSRRGCALYNATSKKMSDSVPLHPHEHWPLSLLTVAILTGVSLYLIGALNLYVLNN